MPGMAGTILGVSCSEVIPASLQLNPLQSGNSKPGLLWLSLWASAAIPASGLSSRGELVTPLLSAEEKADGGMRRVVGWGER